MRKTTQETFEKRCVEKYGDRFTFDKTIYINNRTKVILFDTYTNEYIEALPQDVYNGKIRTKNKKFTTKNFIKWSKEIFGDNFTYDKSICNNSTDKVIITCKKHGDFEKIAYSHINQKQGCPKCSDNFRTKNMIISEAVKIFGDLYDYSLVKDSSPNDKIQIICKEHGIFTKTPHEHIVLQKGCPFCAREKHKKKVNEFIVDSNLKNRHLEIIDDYKSMGEKIMFKCLICGYKWMAAPSKIQCGNGCPKCNKKVKPTTNELIERFNKIHGNKYIYDVNNIESTIYNSNYKINIKCPIHGNFNQSYYLHLNGCGCPTCSESKLEREMRLTLEENKIEYKTQHVINGLKNVLPLKLDFFIPQKNIAIECQGKFHFEIINGLGGKQGFDSQHKNDIIKQQFCKDNNIQLLYFTKEKQDTFLGDKCFHNVNDIIDILKQ